MKYLFTSLLLIAICINSSAQVAVIDIENKAGSVNVRLAPNSKSKIIYQIKTDQVFGFAKDRQNKNSEWATVYIRKNNFSFGRTASDYLKGFVPKSKIKPLYKKEEYTGAKFTFKYVTKPFTEKDKIIDYAEGGRAIDAINGLNYWGSDGEKPNTEIEKIKVQLNGKKITVPEFLTMDIYECDNDFKIYKTGKTYFVHHGSGDGAGSYEIVWVITKDGIKQRLVGAFWQL